MFDMPIQSHRLLPWHVAESSIQLLCQSIAHESTSYSNFYSACTERWFHQKINDILQFWQINFSLFKDDFLEGMNSASDMFPVIDIKLLH